MEEVEVEEGAEAEGVPTPLRTRGKLSRRELKEVDPRKWETTRKLEIQRLRHHHNQLLTFALFLVIRGKFVQEIHDNMLIRKYASTYT